MFGRQMLRHEVGAREVGRKSCEEGLEGLQPARRRPDAHNEFEGACDGILSGRCRREVRHPSSESLNCPNGRSGLGGCPSEAESITGADY